MFGVGDTVVYGTQGVCRIERTESRRVRGEYIDCLVLPPVYDSNSTLFIPKNNEKEKNSILIMIKKMRDLMLCNY